MTNLLEGFSTAVLLILLVLLFSHLLHGTANTWLLSKIKAAPA